MNFSRRRFAHLISGGVFASTMEAVNGQTPAADVARSTKAMVFDVFGTVVDWRGSIIAEGTSWGKARGLDINWAHFADRWRGGYGPAMERVRKGELPWTKIDALHRRLLDELLKEFGLNGLTEEEKDHWNRVWHRLKPWPDSVAGLTRLKKKYTIGPLSNGNVSLLTDMAKKRGTALGSHSFRGVVTPLQTGSRSLPDRSRIAQLEARRSYDVRRALRRPSRRSQQWSPYRVHLSAERAWAGRQSRQRKTRRV